MRDVKRAGEMGRPCIWAEAGVLSYRLCDREYECEACPLFRALSGEQERPVVAGTYPAMAEPEGPSAQVSRYLARLLAGCAVRLDRTYSAAHWWLDQSGSTDVKLGLEEHVLRVLAPIDDIVAPRWGSSLSRFEPCARVVRGRSTVPLYPPVGGMVEEVNGRYADTLRVWGAFPGGDDWLMRVTPREELDAAPGLYRGEAALTWHCKSLQLLRRHLREAVEASGAGALGETLTDGGEPNLDVERVLGRARFAALVAALFPTPSS